jgi:hypothetical protein
VSRRSDGRIQKTNKGEPRVTGWGRGLLSTETRAMDEEDRMDMRYVTLIKIFVSGRRDQYLEMSGHRFWNIWGI